MPYYVYIMASHPRTLYTGVTNHLERRAREHKSGTGSQFTSRYSITHLVYYESFTDVRDAIAREKQVKGLSRAKKLALIEARNPNWRDLSIPWFAGQPADP